jgi:FlgD Ig-like domain
MAPGPVQAVSGCQAKPVLITTMACPAGFKGSYVLTQTFNKDSTVCAYAPVVSNQSSACVALASTLPQGPLTGKLTGKVLPAPGQNIVFELDQPGKVSLVVLTPSGGHVRTLLNASPLPRGVQTVAWDGKDDAGVAVPAGQYGFKLLQTPGLSAEYLMTLQTNLPIGSNFAYYNWFSSTPPGDDRQVGIGNHQGPTAITVDASGIYISSGVSENTSQMVKLAPDGSKRVWSAAQPDVSQGRYAMASMRGRLYSLQQNGYVSIQGVDEPNFPHSSVGVVGGNYLGTRWDYLWPGDRRPSDDDWLTDAQGAGGAPVDMAASDSGGTPQLALSFFAHNQVQWRDPATGQVLDTINVVAPRGVAFDSQGRLLIATQTGIVRTSRADKTLVSLVTGLVAPYRLSVDPNTGDFWVAERGTDQRVKHFTAQGQAVGVYGRAGGRRDGLYVPADFRNITDISPDGTGGFYVTEHAAPRRIARFDRSGQLVKEWYAGSTWAPFAVPEPGKPSVVWAMSERYSQLGHPEIMRLVLDLKAKTWRVHSTYRLLNLGNSLVPLNFFTFGTGIHALRPRRVNGQLFLAADGGSFGWAVVFQVDEANWTVKPASALEFRADTQGNYVWTDANGDGLAQESEIQRASGLNYYDYNVFDFRTDENLNYYAIGLYAGVLRFRAQASRLPALPCTPPWWTKPGRRWRASPLTGSRATEPATCMPARIPWRSALMAAFTGHLDWVTAVGQRSTRPLWFVGTLMAPSVGSAIWVFLGSTTPVMPTPLASRFGPPSKTPWALCATAWWCKTSTEATTTTGAKPSPMFGIVMDCLSGACSTRSTPAKWGRVITTSAVKTVLAR